LNNKP